MQLSDLVGTKILILSSWFASKSATFEQVILHGVEAGGIWIETKGINETFLEKMGDQMYDATPVVFLPYKAIDAILSGVPKTLISDKIAE